MELEIHTSVCYIMLNFITNKTIRPIGPRKPKEPKKPTKRISARQVQDNLDAFIKEQRQVNKILLEFVKETKEFMTEQREFNKKIMERIDNLVVKNNLVE